MPDGFEFDAQATTCRYCEQPHPAVNLHFDFGQGYSGTLTVPTSDARSMAENLFEAVMRAEAMR